MATTESAALDVARRDPSGSRQARRLRREGAVPGIVYGGGEEPVPFSVDSRALRHALAHAGAVLGLRIDGAEPSPVVVKDLVRHPVNGETLHLDLLRVRMDVKIQATVMVDLIGAEDAPGVKEGGVLEQVTREVTIEALPGDIPESIQHDVSGLQVADTLTLSSLSAPSGVTLVDDPETVVATITAPRLQLADENEIEEETELVGEAAGEPGEEAEGAEPAADEGGEADSAGE